MNTHAAAELAQETATERAARVAAVWGCGHIGWTTVCHLAHAGVQVLAVDTDGAKIAAIREGQCPVRGLGAWISDSGVDPEPRVPACAPADAAAHLSQVTTAAEHAIHHVSVPTERDGKPWDEALYDATSEIASIDPAALVIVESTVAPAWLDAIAHAYPDLRLAAAPRRDWFDSPKMHVRCLPRVVGARDKDTLAAAIAHVRRISASVISAPGLHEAALTKIVENDLRYLSICYANELARTMRDRYDARAILALAATKWNIGLYHPGIGCGGPCMPLAGPYLDVEGLRPSMSSTAAASEQLHTWHVASLLHARGTVAILGLDYKAPAPYTPSAPAVWIARKLREIGGVVGVFPSDDVQERAARDLGVAILRFPEDLGRQDALLVPVASTRARSLTPEQVRGYKLVLDHEGGLSPEAVAACQDYRLPGRAGWLR